MKLSDFKPAFTTSLTKATANSRMVLNNASSDYQSSVTVNAGALQVNNTAGLVMYAIRNNMLDPNKYLFS